MKNHSLALLALLALSACADEPQSVDAFRADDAASDQLAEQLAYDYLGRTPRFASFTDLRTRRVTVDTLGQAHVHVRQFAGNVPVLGSEAIVHIGPDGGIRSVTDDLGRGVDVDTNPAWSAQEAIDLALAEHGLQHDLSEAPTAELVVLPQDGQDRLTWAVRIRDVEDAEKPSIPMIFVDAHTGEIAWKYDDLQSYSLSDSDKTTYDLRNRTSYGRATVGSSSDGELLTTHDAVGETLAFLAAEYSRDSFNGGGAVVKSYGHYSRSYVNAFWDGSRLTFGDGDGYYSTYLGVLDVAAHELGHAVTDYEADLVYSNESGALNEAASDMLAAAVEAWVDGGVSGDTWDIGEDCWIEPGTSALRYMDRPSDDGSSRDHYSDRYTGSSDNGGVHWNSGIANHWFYLLSQGGQHHDASFRSGYSVGGVGIDAAYDIWYLALTSYMTSSSDFGDARAATESACAALGYGTAVCEDVSLAWYEVGVGSDPGGSTGGDGGGTDSGTGGTDSGTGGTDSGTGGTDSGGGDGGGDGGGMTCAGTLYTGSLSGGGDSAIEPDGSYASFPAGLTATLEGAAGTDFDLYLYKSKKRGWSQIASSTSSSSSEAVSTTGSGTYYLLVYSYSGSGSYELCIE
ncbi:MAG: M4 family metallopeptidase [Alphaproteobacteria bacterium]|nr:M4 family metallopeptidase [Alphaproteobacteria bacterium]